MSHHKNYFMRKVIFFAPLVLAGMAGFVALTMVLWNALMPGIFHVTAITFWQAAGLILLARLLLGGFRPGWGRGKWSGGKGGWKHKMKHMSPEERKAFFEKMRKHRGGCHQGHHHPHTHHEDEGSTHYESTFGEEE